MDEGKDVLKKDGEGAVNVVRGKKAVPKFSKHFTSNTRNGLIRWQSFQDVTYVLLEMVQS